MTKIIAVCGATGGMGGGVVQRMLNDPEWKVRGVTRDTNSDKAKASKSQGVEVVSASYDDVDSLAQAFDGVTAIFAITNFWLHIVSLGSDGASQKETEEILDIATAAARVSTLQHFVLHSLPSGEKVAGKGYAVPHIDSKDRAVEEIKCSMPELAKKSTFMWVGMFTQNMWTRPFLKPFEMPASEGKYAWLLPISHNTTVPFAGDAYNNVGVFVEAILKHPDVCLPAKYVIVVTDEITMPEALAAWSDVVGRPAAFGSMSLEGFKAFYGPFGQEIGLQYQMHDKEPDWKKTYEPDIVRTEQLGIRGEDLVGHKEALKKYHDKLL